MASNSLGTAWIQIKPSLAGISKDIEKQLGAEVEGSLNKNKSVFSSFSKHGVEALNRIGKFGFTALAATATGTMALITSRIRSAINRIDTLNNFPRVLQAMGVSADDARSATDNLAKALKGLPTALQDGAAEVQNFVAAGLDIHKATDGYLAMNNALLAAGKGAEDVFTAFEIMNRALGAGEFASGQFHAVLGRMPTAFKGLQEQTGLTTGGLEALFKSDPQGLLDALSDLNKNGTRTMASLDKQARLATGGIGTAWDNMGNAIDRGWQALVVAIGGGGDDGLQKGSEKIAAAFEKIGDTAETVMGAIGTWINENGPLIQNVIIPALKGMAGAIGLITVGFIAMKLANPIGLIVVGILLLGALIGVLAKNWDKIWKGIKDTVAGVFNSIKTTVTGAFDSIKETVGKVWNWIKGTLGTIGSIAATIIKAPVNAILNFAEDTINGFLRLLNVAIGAINKIPRVNLPKVDLINIPKLATGGAVFGPGTGFSDSIPAMLSDGEYVIRASAARNIGYDNLDKLNSTGEMSGSGDHYEIHINGYNKDKRELAEEISQEIALRKVRVIG